MATREVKRILKSTPTSEGAGVRLHRAFGGADSDLDPFLLFDDFSSHKEEDYIAGFPWHPHRGMETVTYILEGEVAHKDSLGNDGSIGAGDAQWMSAGSGIIHQEMPQARAEGIRGFQLWVNLPSAQKMTAPKYRDLRAGIIPEAGGKGVRINVIAGSYEHAAGPAGDISGSPTYLDVALEKGAAFEYPVSPADTVLLYVFEGEVAVGEKRTQAAAGTVAITERGGDSVRVEAPLGDARFILMAGTPLSEPVAWHGPIVMNTQEEIFRALSELRDNTFIQ